LVGLLIDRLLSPALGVFVCGRFTWLSVQFLDQSAMRLTENSGGLNWPGRAVRRLCETIGGGPTVAIFGALTLAFAVTLVWKLITLRR
jgi:hypothetical protein